MTAIGTASMPTGVNLVLDPSMQSGIANAQASVNTRYTLSYDTTVFHSGTQSALLTRTVTTLDTTLGSLNATPGTAGNACRTCAAPGQVLSFSIWMRCSVANWQSRISLLWKDSTGTNIGSAVTGPQTPGNPANTWVLVKFENVTAPASTAQVTVQGTSLTPSGNAVGGEKTWYDDVMMNPGATVQPYGDGSMAGWVWSNGPNRSVSIQGLRSLAQVNRDMDPSMEASSLGWGSLEGSSNTGLYPGSYDLSVKRSGTRSWTQIRSATSPSQQIAGAYWAPMGSTSTQPLSVVLTPGETISCGVWVRCNVDQWQGRNFIYWRDATGAPVPPNNTPGNNIANQPLNTWVWLTQENAVVPAGAVMGLFLAVINGPTGFTTVGGEQAWFDDGVICSGAKVQPSWNPTTEQPPGGGAVWLSGVPGVGPAVRPLGPWSQFDGFVETPADYAGTWDGAALQPLALADVSVV